MGHNQPTEEELQLAAHAGTGAVATLEVLRLSAALFDDVPAPGFGGVDLAATHAENTEVLKERAESALAGCGMVELNPPDWTIYIDFYDGCGELTGGQQVTGNVLTDVSMPPDDYLVVGIGLSAITVDAESYDGNLFLVHQEGRVAAEASLTVGTPSVMEWDELSLEEEPNGVGLSGRSRFYKEGVLGAEGDGVLVEFTSAEWLSGSCYPSGGFATFTSVDGRLLGSFQFGGDTADSGRATLVIHQRALSFTLPPYGNCPHSE